MNLKTFDLQMMMEYIAERMQEMVRSATSDTRPRFGNLIILKNQHEFLDAIEGEHEETSVFIHIYANDGDGCCDNLNRCLQTLAEVCLHYEVFYLGEFEFHSELSNDLHS